MEDKTISPRGFGGSWERLYKDLVRMEGHLTKQVRDQQQRIATILAVTGFLVGLLGSAILSPLAGLRGGGPGGLVFAALIALSLSILIAVGALWPWGRIVSNSWTNAEQFMAMAKKMSSTEALFENLSATLESQLKGAHHIERMTIRRWLMRTQLILIGIASALLIGAFGWQWAGGR